MKTARVQYRDGRLIVDGVDISDLVIAGTLVISHRTDLPSLVTFTLAADVDADVTAEVNPT